MATKKEVKNCVIDCRVSDPMQLKGGSLEQQEVVSLGLASRNDWNVLKVFKKAHTAAKMERGDFQEILDYIKGSPKPVHYYICKSIDRFTRMGSAGYVPMKKELEKLDVQIADVYGIIQPVQDRLGHLGDFRYDWANFSPSETAEIMEAERGKQDRQDLLTRMIGQEIVLTQEGYKIRSPNDGYKNKKILSDGKKKVIQVADPERVDYFIKMFKMRAAGTYTDQQIVDKLNAVGYRTKDRKIWSKDKQRIIGVRKGKPLSIKQLQRFIARPIYAGILCEKWTNYEPIRVRYDGLISIDLFNRANHGKIWIRENADQTIELLKDYGPWNKKRLKNNPLYRYKSLVLCTECKTPFKGSAPKGKSGKVFPTYHCNGVIKKERIHKYKGIPKEEFETTIKNYLQNIRFDKDLLNSFEYILKERYRKREKEVVRESVKVGKNVNELKIKQETLLDKLMTTESIVVSKKFEEQIEILDGEIKVAESLRNKVEVTEKGIKSFIQYAKEVMEHPEKTLMECDDMPTQQALFALVFEEPPTYQEILNGTPKLTPIFRLFKDFSKTEAQDVILPGIEPGFPP